jgi:uroporphyrin-III C-methyltransferase/precorrin-2 dehydrogenase/sirohydrochlorin ferrochelatase
MTSLAVAFLCLFYGVPSEKHMQLFPIFVKLAGRRCLVVGAGTVGQAKIQSLLDARARVRVVAPRGTAAVAEWKQQGLVEWEVREFQPSDMDGAFLVIAATNSSATNAVIHKEAEQRNILCNAVDDPENCDFYYGAVVRRGDLQIAISTAGKSPALAQRLRQELETSIGSEYTAWVEELGQEREKLFAQSVEPEQRKRMLHELVSRKFPRRDSADRLSGKVFLVGAGPGDVELLTLKALSVLQSSEVVLHDELVGRDVLALIPSTAEVVNVGKRCGQKSARQEHINSLLVGYASQGLRVVRLKGGDPLLFGRAGEEIEALRKAQIPFEIVPGVTAALAASASAQIPLTHRHVSSALMVLTSHHAASADPDPWPEHIPTNVTLVVYMPGYAYEATQGKLLKAGLSQRTPCAVISQATTPQEQVFRTMIADLHQAPKLPAPTLLVVGDVVRFADHASLRRQFAQSIAEFQPPVTQDFVSEEQEQAE